MREQLRSHKKQNEKGEKQIEQAKIFQKDHYNNCFKLQRTADNLTETTLPAIPGYSLNR